MDFTKDELVTLLSAIECYISETCGDHSKEYEIRDKIQSCLERE